jgi:hypothetical protein
LSLFRCVIRARSRTPSSLFQVFTNRWKVLMSCWDFCVLGLQVVTDVSSQWSLDEMQRCTILVRLRLTAKRNGLYALCFTMDT